MNSANWKIIMENKFEKPKSYNELINQFGKFMVDKIYNKKWHLWRMQSGIELIHYTFDLNKQKQLWENWQLMSEENKRISDTKCIQLFGINNEKLNNYCLTTGYNKEKTKFNSKYEEILKNVVQTTREKRQNKFPTSLYEINIPIIKNKKFPFLNYLKNLIVEDYKIFPVPKILLDQLENFVKVCFNKESNTYFKKLYSLNKLLVTVNKWEYYAQFKQKLDLMLKHNINCSIICFVISNFSQINEINNKYDIKLSKEDMHNIFNSFASIFNYNTDFNACLFINKNKMNSVNIRKSIQHELIHQMQVGLNISFDDINTTHGIFQNIKFNLTDNQLKDMCKTLGMSENEFKTTFEYLLDGMQFEAWVANTCEQFIKSGITIEQFKFIIQDFEKFKNMFNNSSDDMQEMFLFGEICYLSYLNDKNDDRYYYLIEAMKNHGK